MTKNTARPPTPVGWSDTDWIKHLQERDMPHPLAGQHINQGSMDAMADAYEADYWKARAEQAEKRLAELRAKVFTSGDRKMTMED